MIKKKALITGITGQDGSYLAEYLLEKGYEVHGLVRRAAIEDPAHRMSRIYHIVDRLNLHSGLIENYASMYSVIASVKPDELYHLAAQSFVAESFEDSFSTLNVNIFGTLNTLSAIRELAPNCRFYFAGSSEMFGKVAESPQNEHTRFHPRSPYGISKVSGFDLTRNFREAYGLFAISGILFNHESPRRGFEFVTRKISSHAAKIKLGLANELVLGNLDARRDWGHSREYVRMMHAILQLDVPEDFVIATGETHSVREFCELAFSELGLDWEDYVRIEEKFKRPSEVELLVGDSSKAKEKLGWVPEIRFKDLVVEMVRADYERFKKEVR
ncbi:MAG: GDP-mannose 4,6-dehydratase [Candidatus Latescibacteria bacterium]|jgi:GDPmannose 4,6-dehydratase|nr:GDP-mannose 4,6-dehydratase [Candidatus Latescibacterota bacterium]